ncbi:MAG TPA: chemotaxis response regulator protein-glutamate methylesterase [Quisquiliibacterium sp.]|nr:chemotaxis response regulator protein-glutamate methylesterase [Quisquiliibacterium sp.]HPA89693.1 chemotaxis response regulator protein-glutamate methylesterase [Quisquiliibacterium sp.]HQN10679.1 chemotaxis response regulator protein-glutamate methylesterase [Quisquiliibacterium sp.]HQP66283.1 chemotaxis response regulator protein-glutamate methylesterase [Quisquiliibacterium sp.]
MPKTKVLVVDDSALVRTMLASFINAQPDLECVGAASDPYVAREMIRNLNPDVLTLDIEMPRMDGIDFLEKLMRLRPMPVVMVSTLTERGADITLRALELGAIDFVAKPKIGVSQGLQEAAAEIIEKVRVASRARIGRRLMPAAGTAPAAAARGAAAGMGVAPATPPAARAPVSAVRHGTEKLVAIGASTGGTEAIRAILTRLPADFPAIVITQHMPPGFTRSFAERLDAQCRIRVKEAEHGERLVPGHAYIAPGGRHLRVDRSGANYVAVVDDSAPVNRHKPSVDVLFASVASRVGPNAIGVMLTGMGRDGADAMRTMRDAGAFNLAQDEASCVVYGMPREAVAAGAVHESVVLDGIAARLVEQLRSAGAVTNRV